MEQDEKYLKLIVDKINICRAYKPKFGQGYTISFEEFQSLYGSDIFYSWFGLDHPLMYAAHKAAGGITSLYRQIGIGCEQLFRQIIQDQFGLTTEQVNWSYSVATTSLKDRKLSLDARVSFGDLQVREHQERLSQWISDAAMTMNIDAGIASVLKGVVFEVRQGYKSKDSKRQNADIGNAGTAYTQGYLPVVVILSNQIDTDIAERYRSAGWLLLRGTLSPSPLSSTFAFTSQVLGYDLANFFQENSPIIKATVEDVLRSLLSPSDEDVDDPENQIGFDV
jgi:hypothetical protein